MRKLFLVSIGLMVLVSNASVAVVVNFKNTAGGVWSSAITLSGVVLTPSAGGTLSAQIDVHYALIKLPAGCAGVTCQETAGNAFGPSVYVVLGGNGTFPLNGTWVVLDDANSSWIGPRADQRNSDIGGAAYDTTNVFASDANGKAKPYQVLQVLQAIEQLEQIGKDKS